MFTWSIGYQNPENELTLQLSALPTGTQAVAQIFTMRNESYINDVTFYLKRTGSPTGTIKVKIYSVNSTTEQPDADLGYYSSTLDVSTIDTGFTQYTFTFTNITLQKDTEYALVVDNSDASGPGGPTIIFSYEATPPVGYLEGYVATKNGSWTTSPLSDLWFNINLTYTENTKTAIFIKRPHSRVFRKAYIKRRSSIDGTFEASWQEITKDVKKWGSINVNTDVDRVGRVSFSGTNLVMQNIEGRYNPNSNSFSLWYGYASQQRTLIKIECGFYNQYKSGGIWVNEIIPSDPTIFIGIISGSIRVSDENEITLPIKPVNQVFRDYLASELTGYTSLIGPGASGTAANFMTMLRDQTDGSSNYIFRPFFGDTTTYWQITQTSSNTYPSIDTSTASDLRDLSVWDVIEKMAEAEQYIPYITRTGVFKWIPKTAASTTSYEFHGLGIIPDTDYGHTIKSVESYGEKITDYYNRVSIKFDDTMTSSGFAATSVAFAFNGTNAVWNIGRRTYSVENFWMNTTTANAVASSLLTELSSLTEEINFSTSLIPHLNLLDRVTISYDSTDFSTVNSYWDVSDWDSYFTWDAGRGDAIVLTDSPFKILSININLDNLESRFVARKLSS